MSAERLNVLLVDDEPRLVKTLARLLKAEFNVFPAHDGEEALEILVNQKIHVVLSDQRMPGMTGVELLSQVRELSPNTTRILLTGYAERNDVARSVNEGEIYRYLSKPWDNEELLRVTRQAAEIARQLFTPQPRPATVPASPPAAGSDLILVYGGDPQLVRDVQAMCGRRASLLGAASPEEAMERLARRPVQVIIADIGNAPAQSLAFIKLAKTYHPQILTLVIATETDSTHLIGLINEGQIYRYLTRPYGLGQLKLYLISALRYQKKLGSHGVLLHRHRVDSIQDAQTRNLASRLLGRVRSFLRLGRSA